MRLRPLGHDRRRKNEQRNERRCTHRRNSSMENPEGKKHSAFDRKPREERGNRKSVNTLLNEILEIVGRRSSSKCCVVDWKIRFALDYFPPIPHATLFSPTIFSIDTQTRSKRGRNREYRTANTLSTELDQKWRLRTLRPR